MTDVSTGLGSPAFRTAFHWKYRASGLCTASPSACWYGPAQSLHVSSGVSVLPVRENTWTRAPDSGWVRQASVPHLATVPASLTSEM